MTPPVRYLNFFSGRDAGGRWQRLRAITLALQMRSGEKIGDFGQEVDATLADLRTRLPADLVLARTSDQPRQVAEKGFKELAIVLGISVALIYLP